MTTRYEGWHKDSLCILIRLDSYLNIGSLILISRYSKYIDEQTNSFNNINNFTHQQKSRFLPVDLFTFSW